MHYSPLTDALSQIGRARQFLDARFGSLFEQFCHPERVLEVSVALKKDDGSLQMYTGYRSQFSSARGPYKGGIRFHQNVTRDEVIALSLWMSLKTALLDLPLWGGKGGVIVDPKTLSVAEKERLSRGYARAIAPLIGPRHDVPAPDVNTDSATMAWMTDEYSRYAGVWSPGTFTGKPLSLGGSLGRGSATAQGGMYTLGEYLSLQGQSLTGKTIAIQWSGNAGLTMAKLAQKAGAKIAAMSDSSGAIYRAEGLDIEALAAWKSDGKALSAGSLGSVIDARELLSLEVDILVPAALEGQITAENASQIRAGVIVELANGPTTSEADTILASRGVAVIPDILANAGGVTVSYFEQVQNAMNLAWTEQEVAQRLEERMRTTTRDVVNKARELGVDLRTSAQVLALSRILEAMHSRSW